jgi:hypothetical protein
MHTIHEMIAALKRHPDVRGLVRYGTTGKADQTATIRNQGPGYSGICLAVPSEKLEMV